MKIFFKIIFYLSLNLIFCFNTFSTETIKYGYKDHSGHLFLFSDDQGYWGNESKLESCHKCFAESIKSESGQLIKGPVFVAKKNKLTSTLMSDDWLNNFTPTVSSEAKPNFTFKCLDKKITYQVLDELELSVINEKISNKKIDLVDKELNDIRFPVFLLKMTDEKKYIYMDSLYYKGDKFDRIYYGSPGAMEKLKIKRNETMLDGGSREIVAMDSNSNRLIISIPAPHSIEATKTPTVNFNTVTLVEVNEKSDSLLKDLGINIKEYSLENFDFPNPCLATNLEINTEKKVSVEVLDNKRDSPKVIQEVPALKNENISIEQK